MIVDHSVRFLTAAIMLFHLGYSYNVVPILAFSTSGTTTQHVQTGLRSACTSAQYDQSSLSTNPGKFKVKRVKTGQFVFTVPTWPKVCFNMMSIRFYGQK